MIWQKTSLEILETEFEHYLQAKIYKQLMRHRGYRNSSISCKIKTRVCTIELDVIRGREGNSNTELFMVTGSRYEDIREKVLVRSQVVLWAIGIAEDGCKEILPLGRYRDNESEEEWSEVFNGL